jgi:hypothetical protein
MMKLQNNTSAASVRKPVTASDMLRREAALSVALRSERGLAKIAAALSSPVKKHLDYVPVFRKFAIVEPIPDGALMYFDSDIPEFVSAQIADNGTSVILECAANRVFVTEKQFVSRPKVAYKELYTRKYKVLNRVKERLMQSIGLREDLNGFSLLHTASVASNSEIQLSSQLTKHGLARAMTEVEKHRLVVKNILMSPYGIQGIRRWQWQDLDEQAREEVRKKGYLGSMWGSDFYVSDQIQYDSATDVTYAYLMAEPEKLAWMPIRKDADVQAADLPDQLLLGFVGFELCGQLVHNPWAVSRVKFLGNGSI